MYVLGREKSQTYFGFLPFFIHLEFVIAAILSCLSDLESQILLSLLSIYYLIHYSIFALLRFSINDAFYRFFFAEKIKKTTKYNIYKPSKKFNQTTIFNSQCNHKDNSEFQNNLNLFLRLQRLNSKLFNINNYLFKFLAINQRQYNEKNIKNIHTFIPSVKNKITTKPTSITIGELYYINLPNAIIGNDPKTLLSTKKSSLSYENLKALTDLQKKKIKYSDQVSNFLRIDMNLLNHNTISKELRWLSKNSLLTKSLTHQSNSFTQSKK
jgi:hypothetical protein